MVRRIVIAAVLATVACGGGSGPDVQRSTTEAPRVSGPEAKGGRIESPGTREIPNLSTLSLAEACQLSCAEATKCRPGPCVSECIQVFANFEGRPECTTALLEFSLCLFGGCPNAQRDEEDCITPTFQACVGDQ